jgi:anaerobic selenocysteine-containing dehydrogenase
MPRRLLRKTNSTLADGHMMARPATPEAILHPGDADERGIAAGTRVTLRTPHGAVEMEARIDDRACRGTVSAPHGFVGAITARLISGDDVDPRTGMPVMTGVPVTVTPVPAPDPDR